MKAPHLRDQNLLYLIIAQQNGFLSKVQVSDALVACVHQPDLQLNDFLVSTQKLTAENAALIQQLVEIYLARNDGNSQQTLCSVNAKQFTRSLTLDTPDQDLFATVASELPESSAVSLPAGTGLGNGSAAARFDIVRAHAEGGLGVVYAAMDRELKRLIALKQMKDREYVDEASQLRFIAEAEITGGLEHPGIVPVYSFGVDSQQRPFYAMRLIHGESLRTAIDRFYAPSFSTGVDTAERDVRFRQLLDRFISVCNTIAYAHSRGVIHRDIKPANIMLGPFGETLVVDWGLAKTLTPQASVLETLPPNTNATPIKLTGSSTSSTLPGSPLGTPAYMSPEQAAGDLAAIGPLSDIYSLGATLYTLLTGKTPLDGRSVREAIELVQTGDLTPVRKANPNIPPPLAAICQKAMAVSPNSRYPSALDLAEDLQRWLADEPVSAYRDPLTVRIWRSVRRHRTAAAVLLSIGTVCLLAALLISGLLTQKNQQLASMNALSESRLDQAMESYDGYVSDLYDQLQQGTDFTNDQVRFLLEKPQKFYEQLTAEIAQKNDPSIRELSWLGTARQNLGAVYSMLGRSTEAMTQYEQSQTIFQGLLKSDPQSLTALRGLSACYKNLAVLFDDLGQPEKAIEINDQLRDVIQVLMSLEPANQVHQQNWFDAANNTSRAMERLGRAEEAAKVLCEALVELESKPLSPAENQETIYRLAVGRLNLGSSQMSLGELDAAVDSFKQSIKHWQVLQSENSERPDFVQGHAKAQLGIGHILIYTGDSAAAIEPLKDSVRRLEALAEKQKVVLEYQQLLATALSSLANAARNANELELAQTAAERGVEIVKRLLEQQPELPVFISEAGQAYHTLAMIMRAKEEPAAAKLAYERAIEYRSKNAQSHPQMPQYQHEYGASLLNLANQLAREGEIDDSLPLYDQAIKYFTAAVDLAVDSPQYRRDCAVGWHQLAQAQQAADLLAEAIVSVEKYLELMGDDSEWMIDAATDFAECARDTPSAELQEVWSARAKSLMQQAVAGGWKLDDIPADSPLRSL